MNHWELEATELQTPESVIELMVRQGGDSYFGEPVTVLEHCLQAAFFAQRESSEDTLVIAALLHDIGHLLHQAGEDAAAAGLDTHHEELAERTLSSHLPPAVTEPIRLHVAAKRYLCFADPAYAEALSPSSQLSLQLQGGPMSAKEAEAFLAGAFARQAVALRLWDDEAKIPDLPVPPLEDYIPQLRTLWR
jgi:phosphonate degradation associated HDIG domain protein